MAIYTDLWTRFLMVLFDSNHPFQLNPLPSTLSLGTFYSLHCIYIVPYTPTLLTQNGSQPRLASPVAVHCSPNPPCTRQYLFNTRPSRNRHRIPAVSGIFDRPDQILVCGMRRPKADMYRGAVQCVRNVADRHGAAQSRDLVRRQVRRSHAK